MFKEILLVIILNSRAIDDGETAEGCECVCMCVQVWVLREGQKMKECKRPKQMLSVRNCQILEKLQFASCNLWIGKREILDKKLNAFLATEKEPVC